MSNRRQFVRQTITVFLACGLIATLLPGFAAAQDLSTPPRNDFNIPVSQEIPYFPHFDEAMLVNSMIA